VNERRSAWWLGALSVLVALMPLSFSVSSHAKALPALLLMLAGLGLVASLATTRTLYRTAWPVTLACALVVLYTAINIATHRLGWTEFDLPSHILLYLATAAVFSLPLRMRWIWLGFSLTTITLGVVCIVQHFFMGVDRAFGLNGGDWGAIEFAMVLLVLSITAWLQVLYSRCGLLEKTVHGVAAALGLYGALLTQSRGPLLAFVAVLTLLLLIYARRARRWGTALLMLIVIVGAGVLAAGTVHNIEPPPALAAKPAPAAIAAPLDASTARVALATPATASSAPVFVKRFADVGSEMSTYNSKTDAHGAVRERMEMWHTAGHAFVDHPLAGVGVDQFGVYVREQIADGHANPAIAQYVHPHNEYLEAAATGGVPGLLITLAVFLVPMGYFVRHALHARDSEIIPASVGVATVGMYVLCALTDNVFYRAMPHSLYFFLVLGLALRLARPAPAHG
jgi:O-antigen ligase